MDVPTSEVGYTTAMPRREDHEVHKDMWWHWIKKIDVAIPADRNVVQKEAEKKLKYKSLYIEIQQM
jgi:hypothetical protein